MSHHLHLSKFGHRTLDRRKIHWFRRKLLVWWQLSRRRFPWRLSRASAYHHIVSEVLLQRTRAETVAGFWPTFIRRFPNWDALSVAKPGQIADVLKPIGLSAQRAPRLRALAIEMVARGGRFPRDRHLLEALPGVGQYIANAVFTLRHGRPEPLLDSNMARVLERFFGRRKLADIRYDPYLQDLARTIVRGKKGKAINWAVLDFAATVCKLRNPSCITCPLAMECAFIQGGRKIRQSGAESERVLLRPLRSAANGNTAMGFVA
jgi:A/G-specific adenine glycosylase